MKLLNKLRGRTYSLNLNPTPEQGAEIERSMKEYLCPVCEDKDCENCPTKRMADRMQGKV